MNDDISKELKEAIEEGRIESRQIQDPQEFIMLAAEMLDWRIAVPPADENGDIHGLVIGTQDFIDEELLDADKYDVMVSSTESENGEEI